MTAAAQNRGDDRRAMLAKIHIARKDLALSEDTYRALIERVTGKTSSAACSDRQLHAILEDLKRLGWAPKAGRRQRRPAGAAARPVALDEQASKVRAMWLSLWCLGEVDDTSEEAIEAFVARSTKSPGNSDGIRHLQWLDAAGYDRVIRALRGWCDRVGFMQPNAGDVARINRIRARCAIDPATYGLVAKLMLFRALWNRLERAGAFRHGVHANPATFIKPWAAGTATVECLNEAAADAACRALGEWWRRVKP